MGVADVTATVAGTVDAADVVDADVVVTVADDVAVVGVCYGVGVVVDVVIDAAVVAVVAFAVDGGGVVVCNDCGAADFAAVAVDVAVVIDVAGGVRVSVYAAGVGDGCVAVSVADSVDVAVAFDVDVDVAVDVYAVDDFAVDVAGVFDCDGDVVVAGAVVAVVALCHVHWCCG